MIIHSINIQHVELFPDNYEATIEFEYQERSFTGYVILLGEDSWAKSQTPFTYNVNLELYQTGLLVHGSEDKSCVQQIEDYVYKVTGIVSAVKDHELVVQSDFLINVYLRTAHHHPPINVGNTIQVVGMLQVDFNPIDE